MLASHLVRVSLPYYRILQVSFGRNSNAHALRVPLPRRGGGDDGDGSDAGGGAGNGGGGGDDEGGAAHAVAAAAVGGLVDDTVMLHFAPPACPCRPAAEVYANASELAAAPPRQRATKQTTA